MFDRECQRQEVRFGVWCIDQAVNVPTCEDADRLLVCVGDRLSARLLEERREAVLWPGNMVDLTLGQDCFKQGREKGARNVGWWVLMIMNDEEEFGDLKV